MLGVVTNPTFTDADRDHEGGRRRHGCRRHLRAHPGRRVLRPRRQQDAGQDGARPVLRRRRPGAHRLHRVRLVHDRAAGYGAKNTLVKNYLGLAESRWRTGASADDGDRVRAAARRQLASRHRAHRHAGCASRRKTFTAQHVVLAAGTFGTQKLLFKMRDNGMLPGCRDRLGVLTRTNSESIVGARSTRGRARPGPHPRRGDHVLDPPDRRHPRRAVPLRQGLQRDGPAADADDRRRRTRGHRRAALEQFLGAGRRDPRGMLRLLNPRQLERAHDDRAGHAAPGQLDHHLHQARPGSASAG